MIYQGHDYALRVLVETGESAAERLDIGEVALALAALDDGVSAMPSYRSFLDTIVRDLVRKGACDMSLDEQVLCLRNTLVHSYGFSGDRDSYNDLDNANFMRVIDRRKGLPVSLGILYLHAARKLNWDMVGLSFPGHFLVRLQKGPERVIIDPFDHGVVRTTADLRGLLKSTQGEEAELLPEHYEPVSDRAVLLRLQNNIKLRRLQHGALEKAVETLKIMVIFAPMEAMLWRELGLFQAKLGNMRHAIAALETFMRLGVPDTLKHQTAMILQKLRGNLQ